jgi:hypothetical protein
LEPLDEEQSAAVAAWHDRLEYLAERIAPKWHLEPGEVYSLGAELLIGWANYPPVDLDNPRTIALLARRLRQEAREYALQHRSGPVKIPRRLVERRDQRPPRIRTRPTRPHHARRPAHQEEEAWVNELLYMMPHDVREVVRLRLEGYHDREIRSQIHLSERRFRQCLDEAAAIVLGEPTPPRAPARRVEDRVGQRYGILTVIGLSEKRNGRTFWTCRCDCGSTKSIRASSLVGGTTQSCGCTPRGRRPSENRERCNEVGVVDRAVLHLHATTNNDSPPETQRQ